MNIGSGVWPNLLSEVEGIEIIGVANNRNAVLAQVVELQPDVLVVYLMLSGIRSINLIRRVASDQPQLRIFALVPADPPHDRIMLAAEAGALGYVCRDMELSEFAAAIEQVQRGEPCLPLQQTYTVLQDGAGQLAISSQVRRTHLTEVLMGVIPLTGLIAAFTATLWRHYWGDIGVRVTDLGDDPTSRMIDVLVVLVVVIGIAGPLLFFRYWLKDISKWISTQPRLARTVDKLRSLRLGKLLIGRLLINFWVGWVLLALLVLAIMQLIFKIMPLVMVLFIGPVVIIVLIANVLDLDNALPNLLHLPHLDSWRVLGFLGLVLVIFLLAVGTEVLINEPDFRADGLHGILTPQVLGFMRSWSCYMTWMSSTNRKGRFTWVAMPTCKCSTIPAWKPCAWCRWALHESNSWIWSFVHKRGYGFGFIRHWLIR